MSRIDEALRRAADQSGGDPVDLPRAHPLSTQDVAVLEDEPYPEEAQRPSRLAHSTPAESVEARPGAVPQPGPPSDSQPKLLFERIDRTLAEKTVTDEHMSGIAREQYRRVAALLHDAQGVSGIRAIMITSAVPGEGKTLTAANLALTLSESYQKRVLLIDADLRKPTMHKIFQISSVVGLTTGLDPARPPTLTVHQITPRLAVLPAGRPTSDPMASLTSERMRKLLDEARTTFDWVIVDTPPLMLLPDAHLLSSMVDGAVMVVRANSTPHDAARRVADAIGRSRIIGVVLNQADPTTGVSGNDYYYGHYAHEVKGLAHR